MVAKKIKTYFIRGWHWIRQQRNLKQESLEEQQEKKYVYQKFTPYTDVDLQSYKDAFDYVFAHEDVRNVAISGTYGSGKSSLIESLKKELQNPDSNLSIEGSKYKKFLHISLAHFHYSSNETSVSHQSNSNQSDGFNELSILESKILNQLIHQIPAEQIPQSNFVVKRIISNRNIVGITIYSILSILFLVNIIFSEAWKEFVLSLNNGWYKYLQLVSTSKEFLLCSGIWFAISVAIFLYYSIKLQKHKNIFKKLKFQGNEIEIGIECNDSFFDKYLNEVVYVFANADADVIVFEDIDRFENRLIFERLREINTLVNYQLQQPENKNSKILRFFYLVRDDIFSTKDRTKFFDFIIPVIPVVDSSNSYNKLLEFLKQYLEEKPRISKDFLEGLSLYIDDMRLIKNICNEFHLYFTKLNNTELSADKMLAMITYKNLFPQDFSSLHINQGFVFSIFINKGIWVEKEIEILETEVCNKKNLIKSLKQEFEEKKEKKEKNYFYYSSNDFNNYEEKMNEKIESIENEVHSIQIKITDLPNEKLKNLLTKDNIEQYFLECQDDSRKIQKTKKFVDVNNSPYFPLLKYLIRNGYIDEIYADYMTYFYPNSLTIVDKNFLLSVRDEVAKGYYYKLNNPALVIEKLNNKQFKQAEVLNIDLVNYLLSSPKGYENKIKAILGQLCEKNNLNFINSIWTVLDKKKIETFVRLLNENHPFFFYIMITNNIVNKEIVKAYSVNTLYFSSYPILEEINTGANNLRTYINNSKDYLNIANPDIELLTLKFKCLNIAFKEIDYESANKDLFDAVYKNNLYQLNFHNIKLMLKTMYFIDEDEDIFHQNYSKIIEEPNEPLALYIGQNFDIYVDILLSNCRQMINDEEKAILKILNNENISKKHKIKYIEYLKTKVSKLENIKNKELWQELLFKNVIEYTEENIFSYFQYTLEINECLTKFINDGIGILNFTKISNESNEDLRIKFFNEVINNHNICDFQCEYILSTVGVKLKKFEIKGLNKSLFEILVDNHIISLEFNDNNLESIKSLEFIRDNYKEDVLYFIEKNLENYLKLIAQNNELFDLEEVLELIMFLEDDSIAIELLKCTEKKISVFEDSFKPVVMAHVLANNFNTKDLPELIKNYDEYESAIQANILEQTIKNCNFIQISQEGDIADNLLKALLFSEQLTQAKKIDLFIQALPYKFMKIQSRRKALIDMQLKEFNKIWSSGVPKIKVCPEYQRLLTTLKEYDLVRDFCIDANNRDYFVITKRSAKK